MEPLMFICGAVFTLVFMVSLIAIATQPPVARPDGRTVINVHINDRMTERVVTRMVPVDAEVFDPEPPAKQKPMEEHIEWEGPWRPAYNGPPQPSYKEVTMRKSDRPITDDRLLLSFLEDDDRNNPKRIR